MNTAHDELAAIAREGAQRFSSTGLASSHATVTRRVRRHRVARGSVTAVAGVGIAGAGAFGVIQLRGADAVGPAGTLAPSITGAASPSASPVPSAEASQDEASGSEIHGIFDVYPGDRADVVIERLADAFDTDVATARAAVVDALPPEAQGEPDGWLLPGRYSKWADPDNESLTLEELVGSGLTSANADLLEAEGVPRKQWHDTLVIASIAQAEAQMPEDMAKVAAVIRNRLDAGMRLELDSTLRFEGERNGIDFSDPHRTTSEDRAAETPYNTYVNQGLPPTAIGAPSTTAITAATRPADGDWLYFVRFPSGGVRFATNFEEHLDNVTALQEQLQSGDAE
ncbi:endolytic transglycosylase MltG [Demequina activiva]|uniref:Endolytic murein transglycosylase n=1 Tax=Demequina activiva TaxID=1582364 RepID=A0A919UH98_9MICO|nr:endolytic transglycosylase MltG [Demequina activiva]GIG55179.1 hypothetical protein Dac01nite_19310 [Demequina activiva]